MFDDAIVAAVVINNSKKKNKEKKGFVGHRKGKENNGRMLLRDRQV